MNGKRKLTKSLLTILFLVTNMCSVKSAVAQTSPQSDFEIVQGRNDSDIVYRGTVTFEDIQRVPAFHFSKAQDKYKPNSKAIGILSNELAGYKLVVFLGTWCEDSHRMIPQLYKVLEMVHYPETNLILEALDRDKHGKDDMASRYNITLVPTIVVLKDDKEIGRITEIPDKSVEQDLAKMMKH